LVLPIQVNELSAVHPKWTKSVASTSIHSRKGIFGKGAEEDSSSASEDGSEYIDGSQKRSGKKMKRTHTRFEKLVPQVRSQNPKSVAFDHRLHVSSSHKFCLQRLIPGVKELKMR
jgi:hypothetical protein